MNESIIIASAYLLLTIQQPGLSANKIEIIPYGAMEYCERAADKINKDHPEFGAYCIEGTYR